MRYLIVVLVVSLFLVAGCSSSDEVPVDGASASEAATLPVDEVPTEQQLVDENLDSAMDDLGMEDW